MLCLAYMQTTSELQHPERMRRERLKEVFLEDFVEYPLAAILPDRVLTQMNPAQKLTSVLDLINGAAEFDELALTESPNRELFLTWLRRHAGDQQELETFQQDEEHFLRSYKQFLLYQTFLPALKVYLAQEARAGRIPAQAAEVGDEPWDIELDDIPVSVLEHYFANRHGKSSRPRGYLGFHVSPSELVRDEIRTGRASELSGSLEHVLTQIRDVSPGSSDTSTGWVWVSLDPKHLYDLKGWLYVIPLSVTQIQEAIKRGEQPGARYAYRPNQHWVGLTVSDKAPLKTMSKIPLSTDVVEEYGLEKAA